MTRSTCHSETTISMIDPDALLNDPVGSLAQRDYVSSRRVAVKERREQKRNSGECYMGGKEVRMFRHRHDTGAGIGSSQLMPLIDTHIDEKSAVPLSDRESRLLPSPSSSTTSRFVEQLGPNVYDLSSLRTIPSWRNTFPREYKAYAKLERGYDVGGGSGPSDSPSLPRLRGGASPSQRSSSGNLRNPSLRHRRRHAAKRTTSQNNVFQTPLSDLLTRFSHAMTISTSGHGYGHRDSGTSFSSSSSSGNSSSLGTPTQHSSSFDNSSYIPFPSISDESSSRAFLPSPYSDDAAAVFQNKSDAPHFFDGHVKFRGIFEDHNHMQVVFEDATDRTTSSSDSTSTSATSVHTASKSPGLLVRSRRRVSALARAVTPARCKFLSIFDKKRPLPRPVDDDDDPVEYDIPCLAYVTCLW